MAAERFHREARAAAMLNDPHLVAVYDFGPHGEGFYLVMELVEGRTVAEELAGTRRRRRRASRCSRRTRCRTAARPDPTDAD
jgi:serine/threonine protein kinase